MPGFTDSTKDAAFHLAGARCQCQRLGHGHTGRCTTALTASTARFHHITAQSAGGSDALSNCEVLCQPCHEQTASYGRPR